MKFIKKEIIELDGNILYLNHISSIEHSYVYHYEKREHWYSPRKLVNTVDGIWIRMDSKQIYFTSEFKSPEEFYQTVKNFT